MKNSVLALLATILLAAQAWGTTIWINTTSLPNGTVGVAYSATVSASGGCTPYKWWISSGALPAGLAGAASSTTTSFLITGKPTTAATYAFSVSAKGCGGHVSTKSYSVAIAAAPVANFSMSASPSSLSVAQGASGSSTITTAVSNGFNSAITLSASGQPSGVTVGFSPNPIAAPGSGTANMTMTVASGVAGGTYRITATGTGGGLTRSTTISLNVTVTAVQHTVDLSWQPSTSANIVGYNMYREPVGGSFAKINTGGLIASTMFTDMNVASGASYNYVATAVDNTGAESGYSNEIAVTIPSP
jgi:hypothetical protein